MDKGTKHDTTARAYIQARTVEGLEKRKRALRVWPRDFDRLRKLDHVSPAVLPLLEQAEQEATRVADALGGADRITEQETVVLHDFARLGVVCSALFAMFAAKPNPDIGSRLGTLFNHRRNALASLGMGRRALTVLDLQAHITERAQAVEIAARDVIDTEEGPRVGISTDPGSGQD